jgi:hypothetical protein
MPSQDINIKVNAQNAASPTLKRVQQDIVGLDKAAGTAAGGIGAMGKAFAAAGIVAFGAQVAGATIELAKMGAQSLALKSSFDQVQGGAANATAILESLRSASRGMISDYDLMLSANKAALLGVADTAEEMSGLLQIASVRGRAMGISATQAFNDIATGLGRMSPLILDNLGITVDLEATTAKYAATLGKSADALTDAERKQALVNAVMESSASLMEDANASAQNLAGQGFAQLDSAWANFRTSLGESIAPFLDARAKEIADFLKGTSDNLNALTNSEALRQRLQDAGATSTSGMLAGITDPAQIRRTLNREGGKELSGVGDSLKGVLTEYQAAIDRFIEASKSGNSEATQAAIVNLQTYGTAVDELGRKYNAIAEILGKPTVDLAALQNGRLAFDGLADSIGKLSDATRPTAEAIAATNAAVAAAAQPISAFTASFEAAAAAIGENESKLRGIYDTLLDTGDIEGAGKAYAQIQGIIQEITAEWVRQGIPIEAIENDLLPKLIGELDNLIGKQVEAGSAGITAGDEIGSGFLSSIPAIQLVIGVVNQLTAAAGLAGNSLARLAPSTGRQGIGGAWANPTPQMGRSAKAPGLSDSTGGIGDTLWQEWQRRNAGIGGRGIATELIPIPKIGGAGGGGGSSIDSELSSLTGRIKSVLSGALKSGIDVGALLPREDAVEEPARRLADIAVRGFESPWTEYIKTTFPEIWEQLQSSGDPKGAAASILRDFEAGLRPELLDKSRAKELVKRALLGDANMSALASEIAAELSAEMGISLESAQNAAQSVLGAGTGSSGVGTAFGDGVATGVKDSNAGGRAVAELVSQLAIKDNLTAVYNAGQTHGSQYGSGFLATVGANLPGGLIAILVAAVSPGVLATVNAQGGRTGANGASGSSGGAV